MNAACPSKSQIVAHLRDRLAEHGLEHDLAAWVARGVAFAESLPPKTDG